MFVYSIIHSLTNFHAMEQPKTVWVCMSNCLHSNINSPSLQRELCETGDVKTKKDSCDCRRDSSSLSWWAWHSAVKTVHWSLNKCIWHKKNILSWIDFPSCISAFYQVMALTILSNVSHSWNIKKISVDYNELNWIYLNQHFFKWRKNWLMMRFI